MNKTETKQIIVCCDCGQEFAFTFGEAEFYESKGFSVPRRCKPCRMELKLKKRRESGQREVQRHG